MMGRVASSRSLAALARSAVLIVLLARSQPILARTSAHVRRWAEAASSREVAIAVARWRLVPSPEPTNWILISAFMVVKRRSSFRQERKLRAGCPAWTRSLSLDLLRDRRGRPVFGARLFFRRRA